MDTLKAKILPLDQPGYITRNEAKTLTFALYNDDDAEDLFALTTPSFQLSIPADDGSIIVIPTGSITLVDDGTTTLRGRISHALSAANAARIKLGRKVQFMVKVTVSATVKTYWGEIDEVREPLR